MSDAFLDKLIEDLVKGASVNSRENGGPGVNIIVNKEPRGHEVKLANHAGIGGALAGPIGAALGADDGRGWQAAGGSLLGGIGGTLTGASLGSLLGVLAKNPQLGRALGASMGGMAGSAYGGHLMGEHKRGHVETNFVNGVKAAASAFGVKQASLGQLAGSIAGPMLAKAGLGALAKGAGGQALGAVAGKVLPKVTSGLGGMAFDQAASMGGSALAGHLAPPRPPQM
jgi:hypothetical protein